jgi:hypothetical protein
VNIGDLIEYRGSLWIAERHNRETRTRQLVRQLEQVWVPDDLDKTDPEECKVRCNIPDSWPFVPVKGNKGWALKIHVPTRKLDLKWGDWVQRTPTTVFLNPELRLRQGEVLVVTCAYGSPTKVNIRPTYGTVKERQAKAAPPPPPIEVSFYDRLMSDDDG